ncbi:acyltransferase domain-containing protein [Chitinophaga rhizophila]|uniref:Acyltransferase domain-containing protein n=1 Tax=Chitinophaga rhizophila TaxID=2866212 RepID=A0ABS7GKN9_9BACT|nr:acyltransferase domain-containing protein [Chitinophaga rhizophila]MBW8688282.1 acyltransferase domain-containing protein [Chitinophaga rhizophila]
MPTIVFLFAGQGCQYFNMGAELYNTNVYFRNTLLTLDKEVRKMMGASVVEYIYDKYHHREQVFDDIRFSNPAIFMIQYALARYLQEEMHIRPDGVLGSSLGETVAAAVSGIVRPVDMLYALIEQARIIEQQCCRGGMITILGDPAMYEDTPLLRDNAALIAVSYKGHFTVSASQGALIAIQAYLDSKEVAYSILPVKYPFHNLLLDGARDHFLNTLRQVHFSQPAISFYSGVQAKQLHSVDASYFWDAVREPIRFTEAIRQLEANGPRFYVDCSPSGGCINLLTKVLSPSSISTRHTIMNPFGQELKNLKLLIQQRQALSLYS